MQIFNLFMPRVNLRRQAQWYADGEPPDFSPSDSQVRSPSPPHSPCVSSIIPEAAPLLTASPLLSHASCCTVLALLQHSSMPTGA